MGSFWYNRHFLFFSDITQKICEDRSLFILIMVCSGIFIFIYAIATFIEKLKKKDKEVL